MAENIEFRLKVIEDKLGVVLEQNEKKAKSLGNALSVAIGSFASSAAIKGINLVSDAFGSLGSFLKESVDASAESEAALNRLQVALSQAGQLSEDSLKSFQDFATQIQATTAYEDDLVISNIALIQSLTKLDNEGLKRATEAALNLSSALGIDLDSASRIIGKAAEGSTAALGKLGVQFQKGSTDAIAFSNVLSSIEERFGGAAQAQAKTFSGAVTQLSNVWGGLKENVGSALTENKAVIALFQTLKTVIIDVSKSLSEAFGSTNQDAIANIFRLLFDGAAIAVISVDAVIRTFQILFNSILGGIRVIALAFTAPIAAVFELASKIPIIGEVVKNTADSTTGEVKRLFDGLVSNYDSINEAFNKDSFLTTITDQIAIARGSFDVLYNDIKKKSTDLSNNAPSLVDSQETDKLRTLRAELTAIDNEYYLAKNQFEEQDRIAEKERFGIKSTEDIASLGQFELDKSELLYQAAVDRANLLGTEEEKQVARSKALREKELRDLQINQKTRAEIRQQEIKDQQTFFSVASSLASSKSKELAMIGKASAITEIAIKTPQAVASSFAFGSRIGGPVLGATLGAIAATAMAAQAAKVADVKGFADGGIIGATNGPDNAVATVRTGEMVLNANQQKNLFDMINGGGIGGDIVVQVDGREIARAVRTQLNNGFKFA